MKSKCCGAEVVSTLYFNKPSKDFCKECDRECEVVSDCEGCEWVEERFVYRNTNYRGKTVSIYDVPKSCLNCSRHYAQLKDNYHSK